MSSDSEVTPTHRRWPLSSARQAWLVGALWLVMTLAFETFMGRVLGGRSWPQVFEDYDVVAGRIWILVPLFTFAGPSGDSTKALAAPQFIESVRLRAISRQRRRRPGPVRMTAVMLPRARHTTARGPPRARASRRAGWRLGGDTGYFSHRSLLCRRRRACTTRPWCSGQRWWCGRPA